MKNVIPQQYEGGQMDTAERTVLPSVSAAKEFYHTAKQKLLNVSNWAEICKVPVSVFTLTDANGNPIHRAALEGDYLKIDIPGPGTSAGNGYDWVHIEKITEETGEDNALIALQVRPSVNPTGEEKEIAHFFKDSATTTFLIKQINNIVYAEEHGRNEIPNTDSSLITDNLRNRIVGWTAKIGLSYPQWKSLVKGLVEKES